MAAIDRREETAADGAEALGSAGFVRLIVAPSADAIAAAGILAKAFDAAGRPYHARISAEPCEETADEGRQIDVGTQSSEAADGALPAGDATRSAAALVRSLGGDPDPALVAAGRVFGGDDEESPLSRRAGLGTAIEDLADGLAHSSLVHGPYSGDRAAAEAFLGDLDVDAHREVASAVALATVADAQAAGRAAETVPRFLRPATTPEGPFATAPGTADVLDILAAEDPGLGVAVACGQASARVTALDVWRNVSKRLHTRLRTGESARYSGLVVLRADEAAAPFARLVRDARSPEPTVAVLTDTRAAVASAELGDVLIDEMIDELVTARVAHGDGRVSGRLASGDDEFVESLREGVA